MVVVVKVINENTDWSHKRDMWSKCNQYQQSEYDIHTLMLLNKTSQLERGRFSVRILKVFAGRPARSSLASMVPVYSRTDGSHQ